jgi:hypothetical protein
MAVPDDDESAWLNALAELRQKQRACVDVIAEFYGHPIEATPVEVLEAVNKVMRAGYDIAVEYTRRTSTAPPPPPVTVPR